MHSLGFEPMTLVSITQCWETKTCYFLRFLGAGLVLIKSQKIVLWCSKSFWMKLCLFLYMALQILQVVQKTWHWTFFTRSLESQIHFRFTLMSNDPQKIVFSQYTEQTVWRNFYQSRTTQNYFNITHQQNKRFCTACYSLLQNQVEYDPATRTHRR